VARRSSVLDGTSDGREPALTSPGKATCDLLCGGFPCQDLSVAGRRAGLTGGERSSLFFEYARVADLVLADGGWLLIENVPGLLSSNGGRDFAVLLATLAELGFHDLAWRVLDSRYFGVPQRRRRVFIVARRARGRRSAEVLLEPESGGGDPQTRGEAGAGTAFTSALGTTRGGGHGLNAEKAAGGQLVTARTLTQGERYDGDTETFIADTLTSGSHPGSNMPGRRREDDTNIVAYMPHRTLQKDGSILEGFAPREVIDALHQPTGNKEPLIASTGVRRLTPVECERLQGFPDGWTDLGPDSRRYAALGDAVTVPVAEWIGRRIMEVAA